MISMAIVIVVIISIIAAFAALLLKIGSKKVKKNNFGLFENKEVILGIFLYLAPLPLYLYSLKIADLSVVYPLTALSYVWVAILSQKLLKEEVNRQRWVGIALIILGVVMVNI